MTVPKPSLHILCLNTRIIAWILNSSRYGVFARSGCNLASQRPRTPQKHLDRPIRAWAVMGRFLPSQSKATPKVDLPVGIVRVSPSSWLSNGGRSALELGCIGCDFIRNHLRSMPNLAFNAPASTAGFVLERASVHRIDAHDLPRMFSLFDQQRNKGKGFFSYLSGFIAIRDHEVTRDL